MYCLDPVFSAHSPQAQAMASMFSWFMVLSVVIFLIVAGLVTYGIVRYRARPDSPEPRQTFGSRRWEITWTVIPLLIVLVLFGFTIRTMAFVDAPLDPAGTPDVVITGHQWWWEARYPNGAVTSREIHIPAGRRLLARIESADVIHDFWVPQLARKMDAVPGRSAYLYLQADSPGAYSGTCSEFCGKQHAGMRFTIIAEPEAEFSVWVARQAQNPPYPEGSALIGQGLFTALKCADCHTLSADDQTPKIGPPLAHIAGRRRLEGDLRNTPQNLALWTSRPQSIKPGSRMPDQQLSAEQLQALADLLRTRQ